MATGTLYVVGTPIGNLEDLTFRAVRVLGEVALVAAEDTRAVARIFARHGLHTPTVSCFEGNEARRAAEIAGRLRQGENVAYVSEAGMPGISDPGRRLVEAAIAAGARVEVVPGPSAATTALVASGLPSDAFRFVGFLPRRGSERSQVLGALRRETATMIFYEAPGRTAETLAALAEAFGGGRPAALCRELTKLHEEVRRAPLAELAAGAAGDPPRGEVTLVVQGAGAEVAGEAAADAAHVETLVREAVAAGKGAREIAAEIALRTGKPRRAVYQLALALAGKRGGAGGPS